MVLQKRVRVCVHVLRPLHASGNRKLLSLALFTGMVCFVTLPTNLLRVLFWSKVGSLNVAGNLGST